MLRVLQKIRTYYLTEAVKNCLNVHFVAMDFSQDLFPDGSFDLVTMSYGLRFVPKGHEKNFVQNIIRWMRIGGKLILVDLQSAKFERLQEFISHCLWKADNLQFKREENLIDAFGANLKLMGISRLGQERLLAKTVAYYFEKTVGYK
ncbi:MAG: class I SAM-dependent methyltransferase [Deltaproteobacteria bacterium]|nr:class I SAM-dependent methyltransferase [Patescibacteria group bacterium]MCL5126772.1 class I SAM-dependent methyltransferase [Deltaproteobacteria bacterium]